MQMTTDIPIKASSELMLEAKAVKQNVKFVKNQLDKNTLLSAVVKGNAYGHGIEQMVPLFELQGINHFSVFSSHEAAQVSRVKAPSSHVMIMGWVDETDIQWAIAQDISFYVFEMEKLEATIEIAKKSNKKARIHIEVETGMNRTGFEEESLEQVIHLIRQSQEHLLLEGLCTHFAGAESITNYIRIQDQIQLFKKYERLFKEAGLEAKYKHTACSAAVISYPETQMDMVRVGILLYGFWPNRETFIFHQRSKVKPSVRAKDPLKRVIRWTSKVMSIKAVPLGEFIGYGTSYQAAKHMKIATVPVGYAYGFSRALSNQGRVIINGKRVAVIGTINMNLLIVDATEIKNVKKGDEVILIGKDKKVEVTVASFGELSNQLNYELLSRLPMDIPRIVT